MRAASRKPPRAWLSGPFRLRHGVAAPAAPGKIARCLAGLLLISAAPARSETVQAFVAQLYRPYMRTPVPTGGETAWVDRKILSRSFRDLVRRDAKRAGDGLVGHIDADPICACQDWGHFSYEILRIRTRAAYRLVTVRLHNWRETHVMTLVLVPDRRGSFVVDDLRDDVYRPSFKIWMAKALRGGPVR